MRKINLQHVFPFIILQQYNEVSNMQFAKPEICTPLVGGAENCINE